MNTGTTELFWNLNIPWIATRHRHLHSAQWSREGRWRGGQRWRRGRRCGGRLRWPFAQPGGLVGSTDKGWRVRPASRTHWGRRWQGGSPQSHCGPFHPACLLTGGARQLGGKWGSTEDRTAEKLWKWLSNGLRIRLWLLCGSKIIRHPDTQF